jgi:hypothetical protein
MACSCSVTTCSAAFKAETNFSGRASFNFTVTANGQISNVATGIFNIAAPSTSYDDYTSINFDVKTDADGFPPYFTGSTPVFAGKFTNDNTLYVGATSGLVKSNDHGQSYSLVPQTISHMTDIRTIYEDDINTLYIGHMEG